MNIARARRAIDPRAAAVGFALVVSVMLAGGCAKRVEMFGLSCPSGSRPIYGSVDLADGASSAEAARDAAVRAMYSIVTTGDWTQQSSTDDRVVWEQRDGDHVVLIVPVDRVNQGWYIDGTKACRLE